jgi:hypothetical protein
MAQQVTTKWIQQALAMGTVAAVEPRALGSVDGFTGQVVRLALTGDVQLPTTVIAKFPNPDPIRKALFARLRYAAREIAFYKIIAPRVALRVPSLYFAALDPSTGDSVLLLEDLGATGCLGSLESDCSVDDALDVARAIAGFHSVHWDSADHLTWIPEAQLAAEKTQLAFNGQWWPAFCQRVGAHAPQLLATGGPLRDLGDTLGGNLATIKRALSRPPTTVVHSDLRIDNIFRAGDGQIAVIDWENVVRARGATDLGFFAVSSLSIESRRTREGELLEAYFQTLDEAGITGYTPSQCLQDYQLGIVNSYLAMVIAVALLDVLEQRDPHWTLGMLRRLEAAAGDHDLLNQINKGAFTRG